MPFLCSCADVRRSSATPPDTVPRSDASFSGFAFSPAPLTNPYAKGMWRGDCTDGQLTSRGAHQHASLGSNLRTRWIDALALIPAVPEAALLSLRSTDIPRTRESAENLVCVCVCVFVIVCVCVCECGVPWLDAKMDTHLLATPLPPEQIASLLPKGIAGGVPFPLSRRPFVVEDMLGNPSRCPRFSERFSELTSSDTWRAREERRGDLRKALDSILNTARAAGWGTNPSMDHYFDALRCRTCHDKPLPCASSGGHQGGAPSCVTRAMADAVFEEGDWEYATLFSDPELARLAVGAMLYELWQDVKAASLGAAPYKLGVRLAHDTTVAPLLGALGAPATYWVPYASHVEIELWLHPNRSASEIHCFFNGATLKLPQCSGKRLRKGGGEVSGGGGGAGSMSYFCSLDEFAAIAEVLCRICRTFKPSVSVSHVCA
jgi:hypothetical protein